MFTIELFLDTYRHPHFKVINSVFYCYCGETFEFRKDFGLHVIDKHNDLLPTKRLMSRHYNLNKCQHCHLQVSYPQHDQFHLFEKHWDLIGDEDSKDHHDASLDKRQPADIRKSKVITGM